MKNNSTKNLIADGLKKLAISGQNVAVHSSLRSFGKVENLVPILNNLLQEEFSTILMPAFSGSANALPPVSQRPRQNGCDYSIHFDSIQPPPPFQIETAPVHPKMGMLSQSFAQLPNTLRSNHPWHSWSARGSRAAEFLYPHPWTTTNPPLNRLADADGWVLLLGVTLTTCTAIHLAEEKAGRRPFFRWAVDTDHSIKPVRVSGCAKGFDRLLDLCRPIFRETDLGLCHVIAAPLQPLIEICTKAIKDNSEITKCSSTCLRCNDAALGGPIFEGLN